MHGELTFDFPSKPIDSHIIFDGQQENRYIQFDTMTHGIAHDRLLIVDEQ